MMEKNMKENAHMYIHISLNHSAIQQKLTHCKSTILQKKKQLEIQASKRGSDLLRVMVINTSNIRNRTQISCFWKVPRFLSVTCPGGLPM